MVHVQNLTRYFRDLCAVDGINIHIQKGEILGLLGPNGAGKTTTLRMFTGFLRPTSGSIRVKDYAIEENPLEIKKLIGYLPESAPLYHEMFVYDYLDFVADVRELGGKKKLSRIRHLADLCGLNDVMHKPVAELSKGYKQRVGLAHAMMNDPEILIMDEPTSGLDPNQIVEIREIIKQIGKEKTVIISTHILSEAEATCDRIVIINKGRIVTDDSTENLMHSAGGKNFINISLRNAELGAVERAFDAIEGVEKIEPMEGNDGLIHIRLACSSSLDIRENIYRRIKETEWTLLELHQETRSLENIFRELTEEK
ncbi:MAG: ATP-binding cassette domain-containing protein [Thermodesulfobacteriota bacterium]|nr:ATP-binding cassette domain-containing protein [Thermodesulfobacteriota bacterium]